MRINPISFKGGFVLHDYRTSTGQSRQKCIRPESIVEIREVKKDDYATAGATVDYIDAKTGKLETITIKNIYVARVAENVCKAEKEGKVISLDA